MFCIDCGYRLRGLKRHMCPECGRPFNPRDPSTFRQPVAAYEWVPQISESLQVAISIPVVNLILLGLFVVYGVLVRDGDVDPAIVFWCLVPWQLIFHAAFTYYAWPNVLARYPIIVRLWAMIFLVPAVIMVQCVIVVVSLRVMAYLVWGY